MKYYDRKFDYSYSIGVYPTLELLKYKPEQVLQIFIDPKGRNGNKGVLEIEQIAKRQNIRIEEGQRFLARIGERENFYAGAQFTKYDSDLNNEKPHVVLVHPENMGNAGTIIRTMAAFGYKNLALIKPAIDIFDPKVIRSSMGSVFALNFKYFNSLAEYSSQSEHKLYLLATSGKHELSSIKQVMEKKYSIVFGSESSGLSKADMALGETVKIDYSADVDSLNLSVAAGIVLHALDTRK